MLLKNVEEKTIKFFVNVCILSYWASFGVSIYHTSIWFFSPFQSCIFLWKLKMVQSLKNENMISENACEVFRNDVMEEECLQEFEINSSI
jgi:hypothetical protein